MAEQERLTNKERRERARAERKRREAEAARKKQRGGWRNGLITFAVVAVVGAIVYQAVAGGPARIDDTILISTAEAEEAREAAGCEILTEEQPLPDRSHVDNPEAVDRDQAYSDTRPTHSGPHTAAVHPVLASASSQIDEVSSTHNLEHGAIIAWYDPDEVDGSTASDMGDWAEALNENGFSNAQAGVGIMTSPFEDPGIGSGRSIAFRAWGTAMDCDEWNETVAHSFVLDHYGVNGIGPERTLAGAVPEDVLAYEDVDAEDLIEEDAPTDDAEFEEPDEDLLDDEDADDGGNDEDADDDGDDEDDA